MFKMDHLILPINCLYKVQGWELKALDSELGSALSREVNFSNFTFIFLLRMYIIFNDPTSSPSRGIRSFKT